MDLKLYALLRSKIKDSASACSVIESDASETELTLSNTTEYRFAFPLSSLNIKGFNRGDNDYTEVWSVCFTAGEGISVSIPASVDWAVAEPTFTQGYTYYLSFIPFGGRILGVWVAKEMIA